MKNHENIKNTNKALLVSNIILGCLLIIAMAFLAITIINNNNTTASAAPENLLLQPYKFAEVWNLENNGMFLVDRLGLIPGKTYKATGFYGGESLDSDLGATRFEFTAVATDGKEMDMDDVALLVFSESISTNGALSIAVYDGLYIDMSNETTVADSSKSMLAFGYSGGDSDRPYAKNFVVESIVEVEASASNNVLSEPITLTPENAQYMSDKVIEGLAGGDNVAVTYNIDGGAEQTAYGVIFQAYGPNGEIGVQALVNNAEEQGPIALVGDSENGILFMGYLNSKSLVTIGDGSTFGSMFNGTYESSSSVVTITAIEKVNNTTEENISAKNIIDNITGGFTTFLTGTGEGIINFFETIVTDGNGGLSVLAIVPFQ